MIFVLKDKYQTHGKYLPNEEEEEDEERIAQNIRMLEGFDHIHVECLDEIENQTVRVGYGKDSQHKKKLFLFLLESPFITIEDCTDKIKGCRHQKDKSHRI